MVELLKQKNGAPIPLEKQAAMLFAAGAKFFAEVPIAKVRETASMFVQYMDDNHTDALKEIKDTGVISDGAKKTLASAMEEFRLAHPEIHGA